MKTAKTVRLVGAGLGTLVMNTLAFRLRQRSNMSATVQRTLGVVGTLLPLSLVVDEDWTAGEALAGAWGMFVVAGAHYVALKRLELAESAAAVAEATLEVEQDGYNWAEATRYTRVPGHR